MTVTVREARADEYDEVAGLTVAAYEEFAPALGRESWEHYRNDLADVARRAGRGQILVAEDGHRLVGAVAYYPPPTRADDPDRWWPDDYAYVRALAVHPAARMRGVGRALALACVERARDQGASGVALNTTSVMSAAQAMYERLGFRQVVEDAPGSDSHIGLMSYALDLNGDRPAL